MIRALIVALVVLVAILAFVLDRPWLYAVSGASLVAALGWFAVQGWNVYHRRKRDAANASSRREHRLQDFGIVSIRPQEKESSSASPVQSDRSPANDQPSTTSASQPSSSDAPSGQTDDTPSPETTASTATRSDDNSYRTDAGGDTGGRVDDDGRGSETPPTVSARSRDEASARVTEDRNSETVADIESTGDSTLDSVLELTTSPRREEPVLVPLVESLRAAVNAHSVCLLVQEDVVLEYHIRAIASQSAAIQRSGAFSTNDPLLTASMSRQPISVRRIEGGRDVVAGYLRYYNDPPAIDHIALAPVPLRDTHTTIFLLADATSKSDLGAPHARALIEQYAETLALVLQSDAAGSVPAIPSADSDDADADHDSLHNDGAPSRTGTPRVRESDPVPMDTLEDETAKKPSPDAARDRPDAEETVDASTDDMQGEGPGDERHSGEGHSGEQETAPEASDQKPRPRSEIIAEEMKRADHNNTHLALVLVHLNRSESIARAGEEAVASAEEALRDRLRRAAPEQRVERFGELTYGVFFRGGLSHVEPWAINMQDQMDAATGELEGGASIGVAMRGPRHDTPEALRADATQALHEAYKTGTCTIIE